MAEFAQIGSAGHTCLFVVALEIYLIQYTVTDEDRAIAQHCQSKRITRPNVEEQETPLMSNACAGKVNAILKTIDNNILHFTAQQPNTCGKGVMGQRARRLILLQHPVERCGLKDANQKRKTSISVYLLKINHLVVIDF